MMREMSWSKTEKSAAHRIFQLARARECEAIARQVREMAGRLKGHDDLANLNQFLDERLREIGGKYDFRYSVLVMGFARLFCEGWLTRDDLEGLSDEKIGKITKLKELKTSHPAEISL